MIKRENLQNIQNIQYAYGLSSPADRGLTGNSGKDGYMIYECIYDGNVDRNLISFNIINNKSLSRENNLNPVIDDNYTKSYKNGDIFVDRNNNIFYIKDVSSGNYTNIGLIELLFFYPNIVISDELTRLSNRYLSNSKFLLDYMNVSSDDDAVSFLETSVYDINLYRYLVNNINTLPINEKYGLKLIQTNKSTSGFVFDNSLNSFRWGNDNTSVSKSLYFGVDKLSNIGLLQKGDDLSINYSKFASIDLVSNSPYYNAINQGNFSSPNILDVGNVLSCQINSVPLLDEDIKSLYAILTYDVTSIFSIYMSANSLNSSIGVDKHIDLVIEISGDGNDIDKCKTIRISDLHENNPQDTITLSLGTNQYIEENKLKYKIYLDIVVDGWRGMSNIINIDSSNEVYDVIINSYFKVINNNTSLETQEKSIQIAYDTTTIPATGLKIGNNTIIPTIEYNADWDSEVDGNIININPNNGTGNGVVKKQAFSINLNKNTFENLKTTSNIIFNSPEYSSKNNLTIIQDYKLPDILYNVGYTNCTLTGNSLFTNKKGGNGENGYWYTGVTPEMYDNSSSYSGGLYDGRDCVNARGNYVTIIDGSFSFSPLFENKPLKSISLSLDFLMHYAVYNGMSKNPNDVYDYPVSSLTDYQKEQINDVYNIGIGYEISDTKSFGKRIRKVSEVINGNGKGFVISGCNLYNTTNNGMFTYSEDVDISSLYTDLSSETDYTGRALRITFYIYTSFYVPLIKTASGNYNNSGQPNGFYAPKQPFRNKVSWFTNYMYHNNVFSFVQGLYGNLRVTGTSQQVVYTNTQSGGNDSIYLYSSPLTLGGTPNIDGIIYNKQDNNKGSLITSTDFNYFYDKYSNKYIAPTFYKGKLVDGFTNMNYQDAVWLNK